MRFSHNVPQGTKNLKLKLKLPHLIHMCGNAAGQLMTGERWLRATEDSEYRGSIGVSRSESITAKCATMLRRFLIREHYRR